MPSLSPARARRTNLVAVTVAAAALTLIAAGCGSSKSYSSATTAAPAAAATTAAPAATTAARPPRPPLPKPRRQRPPPRVVGERVRPSTRPSRSSRSCSTRRRSNPASTTFAITNAGSFKHNLTIDGPGVEDVKSDNVDPGKTGSVTATLAAGTYEVYCSIPTHKDKGMDMTITVA